MDPVASNTSFNAALGAIDRRGPSRVGPPPPGMTQNKGIGDIVRKVAAAPVLMVGSDFDGAIAPLVDNAALAAPDPQAVDALRRLAWMPRTRSAIISGRDLADLRRRFPVSDGLMLVGSHGAEILGEPVSALPEAAIRSLGELRGELDMVARRHAGALVEIKTRAVALHYRQVPDAGVAACVEEVVALQGRHPGLRMRLGSMVVEFVADLVNKGDAVRYLRERVGATSVVFVGDDLTDEDAFAELRPPDAGVKVGAAESLAMYRVPDIAAVRTLLCALADARAEWLRARRSGAEPGGAEC